MYEFDFGLMKFPRINFKLVGLVAYLNGKRCKKVD